MTQIEMTAKTAEEAIEFALKELGVERAEVVIDIVSRGKAGILGIGSEPARVRVTLLEQTSDVVKDNHRRPGEPDLKARRIRRGQPDPGT